MNEALTLGGGVVLGLQLLAHGGLALAVLAVAGSAVLGVDFRDVAKGAGAASSRASETNDILIFMVVVLLLLVSRDSRVNLPHQKRICKPVETMWASKSLNPPV